MIWTVITAIATLVSMVAYIITVYYLRTELKGLEKDRFLTATNELYTLWQSQDFMQAQLWLLHRLEATTWADFVQAHRGDTGELAFHRVGSFYDRVGTLVRMGLIDEQEVLSTMGGYAIAVWQKIGPLVQEARQIEHSSLFDDFEGLLPACHECYVPALGKNGQVNPFSLSQPNVSPSAPKPHAQRNMQPVRNGGGHVGHPKAEAVQKIRVDEVRKRLERGAALTLLDVRSPGQQEKAPEILPGAVVIPPAEIEVRFHELPADREIVAYCT